jgi:hypothetical protein
MSVASPRAVCADVPLFADGLGTRHAAADRATGEPRQILAFGPALAAAPSFEAALRDRVARLANFQQTSFATVRRVERLPDGRLVLVSDPVEGTRLSAMLEAVRARGLTLDTGAALSLVAELLAAVALLHQNAREVAHGLLAPERLVITPQGRLVIVEHVVGSAIEQLQYGRERLWKEFRATVPASAGVPRIDHRADVTGIGITAVSLVIGRLLAPGEYPHAVPGLLLQAGDRSPLHGERPLPNGVRNWLARTLQLDVRRGFASAPEALAALADTFAADPSCSPAPVALDTFLAAYHGPDGPAPRSSAPARVHPAVPPRPTLVSSAPGPLPGRLPAPAPHLHTVPALSDLIRVDDLVSDAVAQPFTQAVSEPVRDAEVEDEGPVAVVDETASRAPIASASDEPDLADDPARPLPPAPARRSTERPRWWATRPAVVVLALSLAGVGLLASRILGGTPAHGTLAVQSSPAGVDVYIDGEHRGVTPVELSLPAGSHILELRGRGVPRVIPLQVPAGGQVSQYLEFADSARTGMLVVHSQPPGARVTVDGVLRGTTPLTIEGLRPGSREVVLQNEHGSSRHVVRILAGTTASLVAPVVGPAIAGPVSGWISAKAPFLLEIFEGGRLIGTTETDRIMLAAGRHVLEFVNETLGYRETRTVQVLPGKVLPISLTLPTGSVSLNADPWAEVWVDGQSVGETPIGNLELPIGAHEIVFRHPQFGERRHAISVTTAAPVRVSVSMR